MKHVGFINEMGELDKRTDKRTLEFCEVAGMDLVFTMPAREYLALIEEIRAVRSRGTPHAQSCLLHKLIEEVL